MTRRGKLPTRKRGAMRHAARALILLLVVQYLLHVGLLLPIQAIHMAEEREGVRGTRVLRRLWEPDIYKSTLFYLSASEDAVVLSDARLTFLGWLPQFGTALDCTGSAPLHAAERSVSQSGKPGRHMFFYGRVDDPAIETVELSLRYISGYGRGGEKNRFEVAVLLTVPEESWIERNGRRYFLLSYKLEDWPYESGEQTFAIGRDAAGEMITEFAITAGSYGSYG